MDKIMSARVDEAIIRRIGMLAKQLNMSKKAVIENAIKTYAQQIEEDENIDILAQTCGSWKRDESAYETVRSIKKTMRRSQERYKE
jgi:hypothetical protein